MWTARYRNRFGERGSALPSALFLTAVLALVGAALHLAVQTEGQLAVNGLEQARARIAAESAMRRCTAAWRDALARFRLPPGLTAAEVDRYRLDLLCGAPERRLSLLEEGIPGLATRFGPWTTETPLDEDLFGPLDDFVRCAAASHLEPLGVSGSAGGGLFFRYRVRVTGEGRSSAPGRRSAAFCREEIRFGILVARFPCCHWQFCLSLGGDLSGGPRLLLPPRVFRGPVRIAGRAGFRGTGLRRSGLPHCAGGLLAPGIEPAQWELADAADPVFACGRACLAEPPGALPVPGDMARAALGLPPANGTVLGVGELREALGLPVAGGRPPEGIYWLREGHLTGGVYVEGDLARLELRDDGGRQLLALEHAAVPVRLIFLVDRAGGTTSVDGVAYPGLLDGPVYVEGAILSLSSGSLPGAPVPAALAPGGALTVAASGDITVTGHLVYDASPGPVPPSRAEPPGDGRVLGICSAGRRADGSPAGGQGLVLKKGLRLDAAVAVGGEGRGLAGGEGGVAELYGALSLEQPDDHLLFDRAAVTWDRRFADPGFSPPCWPAGRGFEAYLREFVSVRREELSLYH